MRNKVLYGDALEMLRTIPSGHVQTCITSPPYWGLRDYQIDGQLGLEKTPEEYVEKLVGIFREVKRVLRDDGTAWINLGDTYAGGGRGGNPPDSPHQKQATNKGSTLKPSEVPAGLKPKDLVGIPWRVAFALQADGWYLRSDIIWNKPNPMPESVRDRPTKSHEYIFLLSKRPRYYYDADAIREGYAESSEGRYKYSLQGGGESPSGWANSKGAKARPVNLEPNPAGRNKRSVWTVTTKPYSGAHFATFPPDLIRPCILAGSAAQACELCGAPWERIVRAEGGTIGQSWHDHTRDLTEGQRTTFGSSLGDADLGDGKYRRVEIGCRPTCKCENKGTSRSIILDPFAGSGTTGAEAYRLGRDFIMIELNRDYEPLITRRLAEAKLPQAAESKGTPTLINEKMF